MGLIIKTTGFENFLDPSGQAYLQALIMGDHGSGKTPFGANWPAPIIADCEKGLLSVASMKVPYAEIESSDDMKALIQHLRIECKKPVDKRKYQTIIIDTIDTYQRKLVQERLRMEKKEAFSGFADWGWLEGKMMGLMEDLLALPMNVVVNMHTKGVEDKDGEDTRVIQRARLKGDIKDAIFQDFDLVGHLEQSYVAGTGEKKGERVRVRQIRWHAEPQFPALRDRSNKLPRFTDVTFTPDDYWRIFNAITEGLDDLPGSETLETLETEAKVAIPEGIASGGPVDNEDAKLPPAKKATPAKKAAAKKAVAKKAEPAPAGTGAEAEDSDVNGRGTFEKAIILPSTVKVGQMAEVAEKMDHVHNAEGNCLKNRFDEPCPADPWAAPAKGEQSSEPAGEPSPAPEPEPEAPEPEAPPAPEPEAPKAATKKAAAAPTKKARSCGDQPDTFVGKHEPVPGCGQVLTAENATRAQIAMLKQRTYLCDECLTKVTS